MRNRGNARSYRAVMEKGIPCGKIWEQEKTRSSDRVFSRPKEAAAMPDMRCPYAEAVEGACGLAGEGRRTGFTAAVKPQTQEPVLHWFDLGRKAAP